MKESQTGGDEFVVLLQGRDYEARNDILRDINVQIEHNLANGKVAASRNDIYRPHPGRADAGGYAHRQRDHARPVLDPRI